MAGQENASPERRSSSRPDSFRHAFAGIWHVLRSQENARIHLAATLAVVVVGLWLRLTFTRWAILVIAIGLVWMAELFNTAVEAVVDLASPEFNPLARISKDVAAGGVLVGAIIAVVLGLLILGPPLFDRLLPLLR